MLIIHDDYEFKIRFQSTWDRERKGRGGGKERGGGGTEKMTRKMREKGRG